MKRLSKQPLYFPRCETKIIITIAFLFLNFGMNAQFTKIPDRNFEQALIDEKIDSDGVINQKVLTSDVSGLGTLIIPGRKITNLTGIEAFKSLSHLDISNNTLNNLSLERIPLLKKLNCDNNSLREIDISNNLDLAYISCSNNQLKNLEVTSNVKLKTLFCNNNNMSKLDVSKNIDLLSLSCSDTKIVELDVRKNKLLDNLKCNSNKLLESLNLKNGINSPFYLFNGAKLSAINNPKLNCVLVYDPTVFSSRWETKFDAGVIFVDNLRNCGVLTYVPDGNFEAYLRSINLDGTGDKNDRYVRTDLIEVVTELFLRGGKIRGEIKDLTGIQGFKALKNLDCIYNSVSKLDISKNTLLEQLNLDNNYITELDISKNILLTHFACPNNKIAKLDVRRNIKLISLYCSNNIITKLDVSRNASLELFASGDNKIAKLDVRRNNKLSLLYLDNNPFLESLNLKNGNNKNILMLSCKNNPELICVTVDNPKRFKKKWESKFDPGVQFTRNHGRCKTYIPDGNFEKELRYRNLDGTGDKNDGYVLTKLISIRTSLNIGATKIKDLTGIQNFKSLYSLYCNNNEIRKLDLNKNVKLGVLVCKNNKMTKLSLSKNNQLTLLDCRHNQMTKLDVSRNAKLVIMHFDNNPFLKSINLKNGNNHNLRLSPSYDQGMIGIKGLNSPNLTCIAVDDPRRFRKKWRNRFNYVTRFVKSISKCGKKRNRNKTYIPDGNFEAYLRSINADGTGDENDRYVYTDLIKKVKKIKVDNKNIQNLVGIRHFESLKYLDCNNNKISKLDISRQKYLKVLKCSNNPLLESLNLKNRNNEKFSKIIGNNNPKLTCVIVDSPVSFSNKWKSEFDPMIQFIIDQDKCRSLTPILDGRFEEALRDMNLDGTGKINDGYVYTDLIKDRKHLDIRHRNIRGLTGIRGFKSLEILLCGYNEIQKLDLGKNGRLKRLDCSYNEIRELDIIRNKSIAAFFCNDNPFLESLNLRGNNRLFSQMSAENNIKLTCVNVNNPVSFSKKWKNKFDKKVVFKEDCSSPRRSRRSMARELILTLTSKGKFSINIEGSPDEIIKKVDIYDSKYKSLYSSKNKEEYDIGNLSKRSFYIIKVTTNKEAISKKIIFNKVRTYL